LGSPLAAEGAGAEDFLGMARRTDCVEQALRYDAARTGRDLPATFKKVGNVADVLKYAERVSDVPVKDGAQLIRQLKSYPNGAGGIIIGRRTGMIGHAFNWFIENGEVRIVDPVLGNINDVDAFIRNQQITKVSWISTLPVHR
jgi:hypothetical protein